MHSSINFGYPWWLTYGHLPVLAIALMLLTAGYFRRWPRWTVVVLAIVSCWSFSAFLIMRFAIDISGRGSLPTENFFPAGNGRILDIGAGTGRSTIMVLEARPLATAAALDLFGASFDQHFGSGQTPQDRLLMNLKAAGVDQRATITTADMRKIPFDPTTFDAVISAYAMDHLNREGSLVAIREAARVLKPGGEFLLILIAKEPWVVYAFGPLIMHTGLRETSWWSEALREKGFTVIEQGTRPGTRYFLSRR
jgi:SAM-dependent methyltransferase